MTLYKAQIALTDKEFERAGVRRNAPPELRRSLIPSEQAATSQAIRGLEERTREPNRTVPDSFPSDGSRTLGICWTTRCRVRARWRSSRGVVMPVIDIAPVTNSRHRTASVAGEAPTEATTRVLPPRRGIPAWHGGHVAAGVPARAKAVRHPAEGDYRPDTTFDATLIRVARHRPERRRSPGPWPH